MFKSVMDFLALDGIGIAAVALGSYFAGAESSNEVKDVMDAARIRSFPFQAGATLLTMNLGIQFLGPEKLNYLLMFYFILVGSNSIWFLIRLLVPKFKSPKLFTIPKSTSMVTELALPPDRTPFYLHDIPLYMIGVALNIYYFKTRDYIANNIIAFSISFFSVLSLRIEKFSSAAPLLWGLLLYDAFFVYGTNVMETVAVNLQGPVKLIRRKGVHESVLGLGDLVLPGIFIAVCRRFDIFLYKCVRRRSHYWITAMIGYILALAITDIVCKITRSGQPALVYIVPCLTIPIVVMALVKREYLAFFSFSG